jgi:hypothetical protein
MMEALFCRLRKSKRSKKQKERVLVVAVAKTLRPRRLNFLHKPLTSKIRHKSSKFAGLSRQAKKSKSNKKSKQNKEQAERTATKEIPFS